MVYGMYPEVVTDLDGRENILRLITRGYLHKDVLKFQRLRHSDVLDNLLQALALQIGNEVSYNELASLLEINRQTVERYIRILEQAFIIFRLRPFSRNLRKELNKMRKIYFYDLGIRNALINNLNPLNLRNDVGALWENFVILERRKQQDNNNETFLRYFWRTWDKKEVDLVEEAGGKIKGYEIKWNETKRQAAPKAWAENYGADNYRVITPENYFLSC